jgi:pimeloyl-ACP methyl ester carboxylesterase
MEPVKVDTGSRLSVTYTLHRAPDPVSNGVIVLHHGICHTHEQYLPLIKRLNARGIHAAMIEQQSENAGFFRNCIGATTYRKGLAAAVSKLQADHPDLRISSYALHSMGALIGEELQQKHPELRRPTVLLAPIPIAGALPITWRILRKHPFSYLKAVLTLDIHSLANTSQEVRELFFDDSTAQTTVDETKAQLKHAPFLIYCQLVLRWLVRPWIRNNGEPKLLLFSKTDEIFKPGEYDRMRSRYRPLEEHGIGGGHDFFLEHAPEAAARIGAFLLRHGVVPELRADNTPSAIPRPHMLASPDRVKSH